MYPSSLFATAASHLATPANSGVSHTKGSWSQLIASTSRDANRLTITAGWSSVFRDFLVDIGVGGSGSEVAVINNIPVSELSDLSQMTFDFPLSLPAGTRLSARLQANGTTGTIDVSVYPYRSQYGGVPRLYTYGADTANSRGTEADPGTTANVKGSWVELTSGTSVHHSQWWVALPGRGTGRSTIRCALDIGIGGSGSEVVIFPDLCSFNYNVSDVFSPAFYGPLHMPIPAGTRLAARAATNTGSLSSPGRLLGLVLFGA